MASIKIQSSSSGGGSITLTAPTTSSNRTVTLPDADVTLGGGFPAQAWVNFNGVGTVAIRANANVSSITDNGLGDYTISFSSALSDADYATTGTGGNPDSAAYRQYRVTAPYISAPTTSAIRIAGSNNGAGSNDLPYANVNVVR
tara:strand:- start:190 stop:621 length:432 start_codon:yes stop_codon:yes gene_type:complete